MRGPAVELGPRRTKSDGKDHHSEIVSLTVGRDAFYFGEPGNYTLRAIYRMSDGTEIHSEAHRIRIGLPLTREHDIIARDFFTYPVGLTVQLGATHALSLAGAIDTIEKVVTASNGTALGVGLSSVLARFFGEPYLRPDKKGITIEDPLDPKRAIELTDASVQYFRGQTDPSLNLEYHRQIMERRTYFLNIGKRSSAQAELKALHGDLTKRGASRTLLDEIESSIGTVPGSRAKNAQKRATPDRRR
jgi:hypothetical protein